MRPELRIVQTREQRPKGGFHMSKRKKPRYPLGHPKSRTFIVPFSIRVRPAMPSARRLRGPSLSLPDNMLPSAT